MGQQDGSRLLVIVKDQVLLAACVSLECLLSFRSVLLLLAKGRDIFPGLSLARKNTAIWFTVSPSFATPLRVYYDCTFVPFPPS